MRKEYGKILRNRFLRRMRDLVPDFEEEKAKSINLAPGERAFSKLNNDGSKCWVVLCPSPKDYDEFTILIGWSVFGRCPELSIIPSNICPLQDRSEFGQEEYLTRLPQLWTDQDTWWIIESLEPALSVEQIQAKMQPISQEVAEARVVPQVENAISRLIEVGMPYLHLFTKSREDFRG